MKAIPLGHQRPIVLVESSVDDALLVREALIESEPGRKIVVLTDGEQLLEYLFQNDRTSPIPEPLVVLLDPKLPGANGFDILRAVRDNSRTRTLPVVIFSGSDDPWEVTESYRLGANSFVRKPDRFDEMVETIRQLAAYWSTQHYPEKR